jgi:GNAT superfamily N-acetyltransferase
MEALTALIHAAYAPHAALGLRYWGTHQSVEDTARRFASGHGFVALAGEVYVGTIVVRPPQPASPVPLYREPYTWSFSQFAVAPEHKGCGLGKALHDAALQYTLSKGGRTMALDTAAPAQALITMYEKWGYRLVGTCDWRPHTNYESVLMARPIGPAAPLATMPHG